MGVLRRAENPTPVRRAVLFRSADFPGLMDKDAVDSEETSAASASASSWPTCRADRALREDSLGVRFQGRAPHPRRRRQNSAVHRQLQFPRMGRQEAPFAVTSAFSFEGDFVGSAPEPRCSPTKTSPSRAAPSSTCTSSKKAASSSRPSPYAGRAGRPPQTVTAWAPFELTLFAAGNLSSRSVWPDGKGNDRLHRGERSGVLSGTDFVLADKESLVLGFPQNQPPAPTACRGSSNAASSSSVLEGGYSPLPSSDFEGIEEHFTFYLTPAEGAKLPFAPTRKQSNT